ncbi:hypothetical protein AKJ43_02270 [candidate division MSBL1 archaeon SCGC-AAA261D19]|uniref:Protein NO VEIN C-terminal domain-containing protein n=1 Tax=candidate division MSBL1 archaeon SCGC-AAA261D19 TaxID=1698273 RepID=A0A133V6W7_9EURY|nr:hypothetical protein AKJ43_02270 [candidate division MSBL1 archaeon SCGC-AAA261D19]
MEMNKKAKMSIDILDEEKGRKGFVGERLFKVYKWEILENLEGFRNLISTTDFFERPLRDISSELGIGQGIFREDVEFLEDVRGYGPPSFDYVGVREFEGEKQKVLLDVKTVTDVKSGVVLSPNQKKLIKPAKERGYEIYIVKMILSRNWKVDVEVCSI